MSTFLRNTGSWSKAWNAKRSDFLTRELRSSREEVEAQYVAWIGAGYTIYDIPDNGGLTYLSGKSAGKYLCVWKTLAPAYLASPVTGTAQAGAATTIKLAAGDTQADDYYNGMVIELTGGTGSGQFNIIKDYDSTSKIATVTTWGTNPDNTSQYKIGGYDTIVTGDVSIHTSVILTGLKIDSTSGALESFNNTVKVHFDDDYDYKFYIYYASLKQYGGIYESYIYNSIVQLVVGDAGAYEAWADTSIYNCSITSLATGSIVNPNVAINIENCLIDFGAGINLGCGDGTNISLFKNVVISNTKFHVDANKVRFENVYLDTCEFESVSPISTGYNVIYYNDITLNIVGIGNIILKVGNLDRQTIIPDSVTKYTIDTAELLTDANFQTLDALISTTLSNVRLTGNQYSQRYYELSFRDSYIVDDDFKTVFAREQSLLVIWRDDLDAVFVSDTGGARKINNLTLYENDGTTPYAYRNNENFLILAEDASSNEAVFAWYQGLLYGTEFTDFWDDTEYTCLRVFQILEPPASLTWRNVFPMTDSPIECSASFKEMVSVFVQAL